MPIEVRRTDPPGPPPPLEGIPAYTGEMVPFPPDEAPPEQLLEWAAVMGVPHVDGIAYTFPYLVRAQWRRAVLAYLQRWHPDAYRRARSGEHG